MHDWPKRMKICSAGRTEYPQKKKKNKAQITTVSKKSGNINNDQAEKCVLAGDLNDGEQVVKGKDLMGPFN